MFECEYRGQCASFKVWLSLFQFESPKMEPPPQPQASWRPSFSLNDGGLHVPDLDSNCFFSAQRACRNQIVFSPSESLPQGLWGSRQRLIPTVFTRPGVFVCRLLRNTPLILSSPMGPHVPEAVGWFLRNKGGRRQQGCFCKDTPSNIFRSHCCSTSI